MQKGYGAPALRKDALPSHMPTKDSFADFYPRARLLRESVLPWGTADKMKSVRLVQIFSSEQGGKPDAEWCSVEDLPPKYGQKRCAEIIGLNLSAVP
ncbi:hypothetical protein TAMA11512_23370 [Selenomonas sp. TAMA-11512]|nr:hypothetical protein TAMA11512_23370 [Selenomonas sp. TAMA-11512]